MADLSPPTNPRDDLPPSEPAGEFIIMSLEDEARQALELLASNPELQGDYPAAWAELQALGRVASAAQGDLPVDPADLRVLYQLPEDEAPARSEYMPSILSDALATARRNIKQTRSYLSDMSAVLGIDDPNEIADQVVTLTGMETTLDFVKALPTMRGLNTDTAVKIARTKASSHVLYNLDSFENFDPNTLALALLRNRSTYGDLQIVERLDRLKGLSNEVAYALLRSHIGNGEAIITHLDSFPGLVELKSQGISMTPENLLRYFESEAKR
jgi:hypothetical protein